MKYVSDPRKNLSTVNTTAGDTVEWPFPPRGPDGKYLFWTPALQQCECKTPDEGRHVRYKWPCAFYRKPDDKPPSTGKGEKGSDKGRGRGKGEKGRGRGGGKQLAALSEKIEHRALSPVKQVSFPLMPYLIVSCRIILSHKGLYVS